MIFFLLLFAHLLADYPLQGSFLATMKGKNIILLASHAGIWTGTILVVAWFAGISSDIYDVLFLFLIHAVADYAKAKPLGIYKRLHPLGWGLFLDQMIHVAQILVFMYVKGLIL